MQFRIKLAMAILLFSTTAVAQFRTVELAHEIPLSGFVVPVTQNGNLNFRACPDCTAFSARLTPNTRYVINKEDLSLQEFRTRLSNVRNREDRIITVLQHLETNTVTRISIKL